MWAHESRADLEPLRFSAHERSGYWFGIGLAGEPSLAFLSYFLSLEFRQRLEFLAAVGCCECYYGRPCVWDSLNRNPEPYPYHHIIRNSNRIRIACRGEDKILSYPYPPRNILSNLNSKAMDKISSYPSGLLEADVRAGSYRAPRVHSPERPSELAPM